MMNTPSLAKLESGSEQGLSPAPGECIPLAPAASLSGPLIRSLASSAGPHRRSLDPYLGCAYGCLYCYGRRDSGPGEDFARRIGCHADSAARLEAELSRPGYRCRPLVVGSDTDPYQPWERSLQQTRQLLEVLQAHRHPFTLVTKSEAVLRDLDLLAAMARQRLCRVEISLGTLDESLWHCLEPRTPSPGGRLQTLASLTAAGVPAGVRIAPLIPRINDPELEAMLRAARDAGARSAAYQSLYLPAPLRPAFERWLMQYFPGRARYVMSLIPLQPVAGRGELATQVQQRFEGTCRRLGLVAPETVRLDCSRFGCGDEEGQLSLL